MDTQKKTILAIDDNPDILYTLEQICKYQGWDIIKADSFRAAQPFLNSARVDLILIDYHMPGLDGMEAVRRIRRELSDTPIIVLTVEERSSVMHAFLEAGATDYSLKPIKALDLISRIQVHLRYHEHSRMYAASHDKGISQATLQTILDCLRESSDYLDVDEIVERTRIKKKTAYRYLSYLQQQGQVTTQQSYGEAGRPRVLYRLK